MRLLVLLIHYAFSLYELGLLAYVLSGWVEAPLAYRLRLRLARYYEPVLRPLRDRIPFIQAGGVAFDLSPLVFFLVLEILRRIVLSLLLPPV